MYIVFDDLHEIGRFKNLSEIKRAGLVKCHIRYLQALINKEEYFNQDNIFVFDINNKHARLRYLGECIAKRAVINPGVYELEQILTETLSKMLENDAFNKLPCFETSKEIKEEYNVGKIVDEINKPTGKVITFEMLQIPVGSELVFLKDKNVIAITKDNVDRIELKDGSLNGELSNVTRALAVKYGYADVYRQGIRWWYYHGKTLQALREEL